MCEKCTIPNLEALSGSPRMTSYVGSLFGYSEADIFKNTYKFESQTILGTDIFNDLLPSLGETAMIMLFLMSE